MADEKWPNETGRPDDDATRKPDAREDDLIRRRQELEAKLATRRPATEADDDTPANGTLAGFGQALKLSSEFIAGVAVGAGLGWLIDRVAGTSPWGLIVFLLLGFAAGVLNVLRSAGMVAEAGSKAARDGAARPDGK